jgi:hypothetical protein
LFLKVTDIIWAREHGHKLEGAGEGRVGGIRRPVIVPASLRGCGKRDEVCGHSRAPGETNLGTGSTGLGGVCLVVGRSRGVVGRRRSRIRRAGSTINTGGIGARGSKRLLLDTALPVLVGATFTLHEPIVIRRMSTAGVETMTMSYKSVCWTGRVDEDTESNNRRCEENV